MKICYVDEAGCCGSLPADSSDIQPILTVCAIVIDHKHIKDATLDFINLKYRFYPGSILPGSTYLGRILREIKGADLRRDLCRSRRKRRTAAGFVKAVLEICSQYDIRLLGRVWIKAPGREFNGNSVYAKSLQDISAHFQHYLETKADYGMMVADSRNAALNGRMSHSIFTKKFKATGDEYDRIVDLPTFGHSENHAGIQITDLICSAIIFPVASWTYCRGHIDSTHIRAGYDQIKLDYMPRLKSLQYRYKVDGNWRGGLSVSDAISHMPTAALFELPARQPSFVEGAETTLLFNLKVA